MAGVVAGHADDAVATDSTPRAIAGGIRLSNMNPVTAGLKGEIGAVIEQEGNAATLGLRSQKVDGPTNDLIGLILEAQLHARHIAGIQCTSQKLGKSGKIYDVGRRYQIKAAGRNFSSFRRQLRKSGAPYLASA
jgi:hypothetical protein